MPLRFFAARFSASVLRRDIADPSMSWTMTDADKDNAGYKAAYYPFLPEAPAHGKIRNQLFFDWHVTAVAVPPN
jgi:prepilin-type processing-associated H-X9-DG protein